MGRRDRRTLQTGVLLVNKPCGSTSHDVVQRVRRIFGQREVGHTGTLDPMATGLMVLTLGRATRLSRFLEATSKRYDGTVVLGRATTTYDAEGETTREGSIEGVTEAAVRAALAGLEGTIDQTVPAFSAVKVKGERLYAKARRNEAVDAPTRRVTIHRLSLSRYAPPELDIEAEVSKGTYVRSLAVQIGDALGCPAHLGRLVRTAVGDLELADASTLEALEGRPEELIAPLDALAHLPRFILSGEDRRDVRHGRPLTAGALSQPERWTSRPKMGPVCLAAEDGTLCAVGEPVGDVAAWASAAPSDRAIRYLCVLDSPEPNL